MPAQASKALCSLLFLSWRENNTCLKPPDPECDGALPLKRSKDTQTVSLLLSLFPSGEGNSYFTVSVPVPLLTIPSPSSVSFPILLTHSRQISRPGSDTSEEKLWSAITHTPVQAAEPRSPQKNTELPDPPCQHQFPALGVLQQTGSSQKLMESQSQNSLGWKEA